MNRLFSFHCAAAAALWLQQTRNMDCNFTVAWVPSGIGDGWLKSRVAGDNLMIVCVHVVFFCVLSGGRNFIRWLRPFPPSSHLFAPAVFFCLVSIAGDVRFVGLGLLEVGNCHMMRHRRWVASFYHDLVAHVHPQSSFQQVQLVEMQDAACTTCEKILLSPECPRQAVRFAQSL